MAWVSGATARSGSLNFHFHGGARSAHYDMLDAGASRRRNRRGILRGRLPKRQGRSGQQNSDIRPTWHCGSEQSLAVMGEAIRTQKS